jgi:ribosomal-protein-alanine N-acetyltransferase
MLRFATPADAPALFELGSDPEVTKFFSWGPYVSVDEPSAYIDGLSGERQRGERLDFLIVAREGGPIGVTGLTEPSLRDRRAVVGTWLARERWGSGANAESKALIATLAFVTLGLERLGAYADLENERSQAALMRLGFVREGALRRWHRHGGRARDVALFSWLKEEFMQSPLAELAVTVRGQSPPAFSANTGATAPPSTRTRPAAAPN